MVKAVGNQGNWFARIERASRYPEIDGKTLPCIWDYWWDASSGRYFDPEYAPSRSKTIAVVEALKAEGLAIMRKRKRGEWRSAGYLAVFEVANVESGDALTFDVVRRICELD